MKIYLDACCLNRPFDDQTQDRIRLESEAVLAVLGHVEAGDWTWVSSSVMLHEIEQTPNQGRRQRLLKICAKATDVIRLDEEVRSVSEKLKVIGFKTYDALHLACARRGGVDVFLSTDDRLTRKAVRFKETVKVHVDNPLTWLQGVM